MLELDQRNNTYHDFCDVPETKSQGWFPFGLKCAAKLVRAATEARTNISDDEDHAPRCIVTGQHRNDGRGMCIDCDYAMGAA